MAQTLKVTAHRQTLMIEYKNPFGECITECDVDEYTAQTTAKNGRETFQNIKPAQWRSVCRDIVTAKSVKAQPVLHCIARYASAAAVAIFLDEFEKDARRRLVKEYKRTNRPASEVQEEARRRTQQLADRLNTYKPESLDEFAEHFSVKRFTLDEFAVSIAA